MRLRALPAVAALAVLTAVTAAAAPVSQTVVGARTVSGGSELQRYEARTLRPVGVPRRISMPSRTWSFSPDGSRLAVAAGGTPGRAIVLDARSLRRLASGPLALRDVASTVWTRPGRLLLAGRRDERSIGLQLVDPDGLRPLREALVSGRLVRAAQTRDGLALLVAPASGIGPARLVLVDAQLAVREVPLARIGAGWDQPRIVDLELPETMVRMPGLAVDLAAGRAYVVGAAGDPVAEVELTSGAVSYRQLVLRRPALAAKAAVGATVSAVSVGGGRLAVWGVTYDGLTEDGLQKLTPLGLWLVDTRTWTPRLLGADVLAVEARGRWLVSRQEAVGLTWWNARTTGRRQAFEGRHVLELSLYGDRALVRLNGEGSSRLLDLRTGSMLGMRAGSPPQFLAGRGSVVG
jgi:hypothetical protein